MSDERGSGASGVILAFLMGGLTGAALAMLFAPRSGKETRDLLGEKLREGTERTRELRERAAGRLLGEAAGADLLVVVGARDRLLLGRRGRAVHRIELRRRDGDGRVVRHHRGLVREVEVVVGVAPVHR